MSDQYINLDSARNQQNQEKNASAIQYLNPKAGLKAAIANLENVRETKRQLLKKYQQRINDGEKLTKHDLIIMKNLERIVNESLPDSIKRTKEQLENVSKQTHFNFTR
jgi:hypothetical protein